MEHEPLVTIKLSEYNMLIELRENAIRNATDWAREYYIGIYREWNDQTKEIPFQIYGENFTYITTMKRNAGPFTSKDIENLVNNGK